MTKNAHFSNCISSQGFGNRFFLVPGMFLGYSGGKKSAFRFSIFCPMRLSETFFEILNFSKIFLQKYPFLRGVGGWGVNLFFAILKNAISRKKQKKIQISSFADGREIRRTRQHVKSPFSHLQVLGSFNVYVVK